MHLCENVGGLPLCERLSKQIKYARTAKCQFSLHHHHVTLMKQSEWWFDKGMWLGPLYFIFWTVVKRFNILNTSVYKLCLFLFGVQTHLSGLQVSSRNCNSPLLRIFSVCADKDMILKYYKWIEHAISVCLGFKFFWNIIITNVDAKLVRSIPYSVGSHFKDHPIFPLFFSVGFLEPKQKNLLQFRTHFIELYCCITVRSGLLVVTSSPWPL